MCGYAFVCVCVCLLVKDDSTVFYKKADWRVAVAIATEQPGFVSCSSEDFSYFFHTHIGTVSLFLAATPN